MRERKPASIIRWEEPPAKIGHEAQKVLAQLKERPGQWALVYDDAHSTSIAPSWRKLGCEVETRKRDGALVIYVRWPEQPPTPKGGFEVFMRKAAAGIAAGAPVEAKADGTVQTAARREPVEVKLNGQPTGKFIQPGTNPKTALQSHSANYTTAGRQARGVPAEGNPL